MCAFIPTSRMCDSKKQFFGKVINGWLLVLVNLSKCLPCLLVGTWLGRMQEVCDCSKAVFSVKSQE